MGEDLGVSLLPGERYAGPGGRAGDSEEVTGQQSGGESCEHGLVSSTEGLASSGRIPVGIRPVFGSSSQVKAATA